MTWVDRVQAPAIQAFIPSLENAPATCGFTPGNEFFIRKADGPTIGRSEPFQFRHQVGQPVEFLLVDLLSAQAFQMLCQRLNRVELEHGP